MAGRKGMTRPASVAVLTLTAAIWGAAFVAQKEGGDVARPCTFTMIRFLIGGLSLMPAIKLLDRAGLTSPPRASDEARALLRAGASCGVLLSAATLLQQFGLWLGTEAGKSGFLTSCYILIVPLIGLFRGRRAPAGVWAAAGAALVGLWLLCAGDMALRPSDGVTLLCALVFALHIVTIDRFAGSVDVIRMSRVQFFTASAAAIPFAVCEAAPDIAGWAARLAGPEPWGALLYAGVMSSGVAYTLQCVGQRGAEPALASIVMSLEAVFSALAGAALLGERMTARETAGCAVILGAVILAQLPARGPRGS